MKQLHLGVDGYLPIQIKPEHKYYVMVYTNRDYDPMIHSFKYAYYTVVRRYDGKFCLSRHEIKEGLPTDDTYFTYKNIQDTLQQMTRFSNENSIRYASYRFENRQEFLESDL